MLFISLFSTVGLMSAASCAASESQGTRRLQCLIPRMVYRSQCFIPVLDHNALFRYRMSWQKVEVGKEASCLKWFHPQGGKTYCSNLGNHFVVPSPTAMPGFPLLNPPSLLVERIISKVFVYFILLSGEIFQVESKSNFRLRQTCHDVKNLIETRANISVRVEGEFLMKVKESSSFELCQIVYPNYYEEPFAINDYRYKEVPVDIESYCGTRLKSLSLPCDDKEN